MSTSPPTLRVTGNSHVVALADAAPPPGADFPVFPIGIGHYESEPFSVVEGGTIRLTEPVYAANFLKHLGTDRITPDGTWGFLSVDNTTRIFRHRSWARFEPMAIARPGARPVSQGVLERIVERQTSGVRLLLEQAQQIGLDFFVVSGPPPRRDHPALQRIRPEVVLHLDRTVRALWAAWLDERGIATVLPPPESFAPDGFLEERFHRYRTHTGKPDRHHANAEYGALMRARVAALVAAR